MLDRILHGLLELLLDLLEATDVVPRDLGDLDDCLAKGRGVRCTKRKAEVIHRNPERVEDLSIDRVLV
jgi:hypothetical protein